MRIDFFVLQWFHENKLSNTLFNILPLEILTKIWKLKRKEERKEVQSVLYWHVGHMAKRCRVHYRFHDGRLCTYMVSYKTENSIVVLPEVNTFEYPLIKRLSFYKTEPRFPSLGMHLDLPVTVEGNVNPITKKRKLFSVSTEFYATAMKIEHENCTESKKRYDISQLPNCL